MNKVHKKAVLFDKAGTVLLYAVAAFFILLLLAFTVYVVGKGILSYEPKYIGFKQNGIGVALFNTAYIVIVTLIISVPMGISTGIYMAEYAKNGKFTSFFRVCIETLSSLPSIVVGMFGLLAFVNLTHSNVSILAGGLTLSVLNIPLIARITEDAIRNVPDAYREGSYALGATKWQNIVKVLVPSSVGRIVTGIILATGRCFGEAAALIYTAGMGGYLNFSDWNPLHKLSPLNIFRPANSLAVHIWYLKSFAILPDASKVADMAAALLIIMVFAFNLGSRFVGNILERKLVGIQAYKKSRRRSELHRN